MTRSTTSMNNRRPAGSRECEPQGPAGPYANLTRNSKTLKVLTRTESSIHVRGPIFSGAALFATDPDTKPTKV